MEVRAEMPTALSQPIEPARELNAAHIISYDKPVKMLAPKGGARASLREHSDYSLSRNDLQQKNARAVPESHFGVETEPMPTRKVSV